MSSLTIQLDPVALREATSQAIMGMLTPEVRTAMIERSISNLLSASTDSWDKGKTPLQKAFNEAVEQVARDLAKKAIAEDTQLVARVNDLLHQSIDRILKTDPEKLTERMADAFIASLRSEYR